MSIRFRCEHCNREVTAPDEAGGKRGKCPYCGQSSFIPAPVAEEDILPLAPEDEAEEKEREREVHRLMEQEREIFAGKEGQSPVPLEHRENLQPEDLHPLVVNYCLDLLEGNLPRAQTYAAKLRQFGPPAVQAVESFLGGKVREPALAKVPPRVLQGFLAELRDKIRRP